MIRLTRHQRIVARWLARLAIFWARKAAGLPDKPASSRTAPKKRKRSKKRKEAAK